MTNISPLAFVNPGAKLGNNVTIGPFAYIDEGVVIGDDCIVRSHASILRGTKMGRGNIIYEGAVIGAEPQDFRWNGDPTDCIIGNNNKIREHVIINRAIRPGSATKIGDGSFIMAQCHIGHDSAIGSSCVLGNAVKIAGDCKIGDYSILSSNALMHERCAIGEWAMIKGGTRVNSNVPPFAIMAHNPIVYDGVNAIILSRGGQYSDEEIEEIAKCLRHLYQSNTSVENAVRRILADVRQSEMRDRIIAFIRNHNFRMAGIRQDLMEE